MDKRICFAVQRYGREIVGGAEALCMRYVRELKAYYDIEVVTSCALDYDTWENYFPKGRTEIDGTPVYRYPSRHPRRPERIGPLTEAVYGDPDNSLRLGRQWLREVGPYCPGILRHLKKRGNMYDLFVFVGYHYYNSTFGLPCVPEKAVFLPTAHDEPPLRKCNYFKYLFGLPRAYIFLSGQERDFVTDFFHLPAGLPHTVAGAWVDLPEGKEPPGVEGEYIAYAGRIDETKNCHLLLKYFSRYKEERGGALRLVLMGRAHMELPQREDIVYTGFVSEARKRALIEGARAFVMPSENESLSIVTLEAMACGAPVLACGRSAVLRGHIQRSQAGFCYTDAASFVRCLDGLLDGGRRVFGDNGRRYVRRYYAKEEVVGRVRALLDGVGKG